MSRRSRQRVRSALRKLEKVKMTAAITQKIKSLKSTNKELREQLEALAKSSGGNGSTKSSAASASLVAENTTLREKLLKYFQHVKALEGEKAKLREAVIAVDSELKDKSLGDAVRMVLHHYQSARSNVAQLHEANDQIQLMHKEMQVQAQEKEALKVSVASAEEKVPSLLLPWMNARKKLVQNARDSKRKWRERSKILTAFARRCSAQKMPARPKKPPSNLRCITWV